MSDETELWALDDPDLPDEFAHLRPDAPSVQCSRCRRSTWARSEFGQVCDMPQPDGSRCVGRFPRDAGRPVSDETERENLAKAEQWLARIVDGFRPPMETSMDKAATIQTEYDRRGREVDGLKYRLECEASFTAAHQASALKWAALVAEQKDDMESLRTERDAFRGSAEHWAAEFRAVKASVAPLSEELERAEAERDEALGLLKKAVRMINDEDALTHSEWTREVDAWLAQTEALVERTSQGGET